MKTFNDLCVNTLISNKMVFMTHGATLFEKKKIKSQYGPYSAVNIVELAAFFFEIIDKMASERYLEL